MKAALALLAAACFLQVCTAADYPPAPQSFDAAKFTAWDKQEVAGSRRANIDVSFTAADGSQDTIKMWRLDLVGDSHARGFAHGALLAKEVAFFIGPALDKYIINEVMGMHVDKVAKLPVKMQEILADMKKAGSALAPKIFRKAMLWVWNTQIEFTPQYIKDEISGIAEGMCSVLGDKGDKCDVEDWKSQLQATNMLPELIRMACTAFGAWGKATSTGSGLQLRALDFGAGPWAGNTLMAVHRNDPSNPDHAFVSISFPGFVGAITGVAQNGVGISEKVWMTYDTPDLQPGTFKGEADVFVLRDILNFAKNRQDAEDMVQRAKRTWAIWIGVGDYASGQFDLIGYKEKSAIVYNDKTIGSMTGMPYLESVVYVDKHPQPSNDGPNGTLPTALTDFYGKISLATTKQIIQHHATGDVHWAAYDFGANQMELAIGKTAEDGMSYGANDVGAAYNRPTVQWSLSDLWSGN